ncbi:hypothetical protein FOCC_FOCC012202 [Frankliniella occidentalis]|nr:hypothetical protein FOCC_FOCC012202 [Frankliniella occidentalis]
MHLCEHFSAKMVEVECGGFTFSSNFESGNMARVEQVPLPPKPPPLPGQSSSSSDVPDYEFNIWTNPDCAGTEFENSNRSWFYFGIRGGTPFALVKLNLVNLNRQVKMYSQGMAPVYRILPGRGLWDRIREKPTYTIEDSVFTLSFRYRTLENIKATTYFAFTFPYSYQDLLSSLRGFDKRFKNCLQPEKYFPGQGFVSNPDDIYYHREVASFSLDGRRLDLLTITSHHGITPYREPRLKNLFPDLETPRPYIFSGKKVIFVSARVHPGEVPSSYVLNGLLESLLNRDDLTSILLRRMYVFKVIPMLNPDGVARGHFRTDTRGVNLNRVYLNPSLVYHPTIYAARAIIRYAHFGQEVNDDASIEHEPVEQAPELPSHPGTLDTASVIENSDTVCQDIQQGLLSTCNPPSNLQNFLQPLSCSLQACEPTNVIDTPIIMDKDVNMHCEPAQAEEDLQNSEDNNTSQGSSDPIEMDVEKEKIEKTKKEISDVLKDSFCAGFPSATHGVESLDEHQFVTSPEPAGDTEVGAEIEIKNQIAENIEVTALKKGANNIVSCDENMGPEEVRRRKEMKRKPGSSEASKSIRIFTRPVSRNEDDGKNDEISSCHGNNIGACVNGAKPTLDPSKSGLFLYMDMHGHASKKGIFMYGNHFDDLEQLVECMLLPKLMSINSQNFHFTACNFTERNMYLRDRRDGTSREGCGRVSVMKLTGLVRSYTLECNYNTGRMVNLLPPCVRDSGRMSVNPAYAVPPKYTPLVFEEVGRALGVSVLDLTSSNPCSRIPNSEYRSVNGIRDWLRSNCLSDSQLWTRMLHRPTRPQVSQSSSSQMVAGSSGQKPIHLTKSVLLARISTELKSLGEEYARKEQLRIQKTSSCSQLDSMEGVSIPPPKENIGPGQCSSRSRRIEGTSLQAKASTSGVLQQRAKTLSVVNLATTSRKKQKSSATGSGGPLRPVPKSKGFRRSKTQESATQNSSASGDSCFNDEGNAETEAKNQTSLELCATPKRLKVSNKGMSGKLRRKPAVWTVKSMETEDKIESHSEAPPLLWASNRNPAPPVACKKAAMTSKIEKSRVEVSKIRSGVFSKVKSFKKLSQPDSSVIGENSQIKLDEPSVFVKLVDRLPGTKVTKLTPTETFKNNSGPTVSKDWPQCKNSSRNLLIKAGKVDLSLPGPSSGEQSGFEGNQFAGAGTSSRVEQKLKSSVLRSLEKGAKSRLLCPVRRRSNDGKKTRKNVDRKPSGTENSLTSVCTLRNDAASDDNCAN